MSDTTNLTIRIDKKLKEQAEQLFSELGMNIVKVKHFFHDFGKNFFLSAVSTFLVVTVNRILS